MVPIEHAWEILGRNVRCHHDVRIRPQMIRSLRGEGAAIPLNDIRILFGLMRDRFTACMRADGGHTAN